MVFWNDVIKLVVRRFVWRFYHLGLWNSRHNSLLIVKPILTRSPSLPSRGAGSQAAPRAANPSDKHRHETRLRSLTRRNCVATLLPHDRPHIQFRIALCTRDVVSEASVFRGDFVKLPSITWRRVRRLVGRSSDEHDTVSVGREAPRGH